MPGRKRKPSAQRESEGNPGHRPIPVELDFSAAGEIGKPSAWLDKDAKKEYRRITTALADLDMLRSTDAGVLDVLLLLVHDLAGRVQSIADLLE
jgi:phage terminase small subunit